MNNNNETKIEAIDIRFETEKYKEKIKIEKREQKHQEKINKFLQEQNWNNWVSNIFPNVVIHLEKMINERIRESVLSGRSNTGIILDSFDIDRDHNYTYQNKEIFQIEPYLCGKQATDIFLFIKNSKLIKTTKGSKLNWNTIYDEESEDCLFCFGLCCFVCCCLKPQRITLSVFWDCCTTC